MGVQGLEWYMDRNRLYEDVKIQDLVSLYRSTTKGKKQPVVVVDGNSTMGCLYDVEGCWLNGGQLREFKTRLEEWVTAWTKLGVRLVFFFDGHVPDSRRETWIKRRQTTVKQIERLMDDLARMKELRSQLQRSKKNDFLVPFDGFIYTIVHVLKNCSGCEVVMTLVEADEEVAAYAINNDCFAILGRDSDFVIYNYTGYYMGVHRFNIQTMSVRVYDRLKLAAHLNIEPHDLPLFAALAENKLIMNNLGFLKGHWASSERLGQALGEWVTKLAVDPRPLKQKLCEILPSNINTDEAAPSIVAAVDNYNFTTVAVEDETWDGIWKLVLERCKELHVSGGLQPEIYDVVKWSHYHSTAYFEDFRQTDFPPSAAVLLRLRRLIYGVLLFEKPVSNVTVEELVVDSHDFSRFERRIQPEFPPQEVHPGLLTLWDGDESPDKLEKRWALIGHIMAITTNQLQLLRQMRPSLIIPVLSILYLLKQTNAGTVKWWEVAAVISLAVMLHTYTSEELTQLPASSYDSRATRLYTLFCRCFSGVKLAVETCGSPFGKEPMQLYNYMDGKLYQIKYRGALAVSKMRGELLDMARVLCSETERRNTREELVKEFLTVFKFIYETPCG